MGIAAHIARLRVVIGHELLLVPSVSVLPVDEAGRVLLVRHAGHDDGWGVLGGAVDVGESPAAAAVRETREEISAEVQLVRLVDVLGGPDYEISYPNGDRTAYVTAVYEARIITGSPAPGDGELSAVLLVGVIPGYTEDMKTAISLPDDTYEQATRQAEALGISRSEFFARAARSYLDQLASRSLNQQINQALETADDDSNAAAAAAGRSYLAGQGDW
jgi:ADP-ribose pyrophosphatase YjhB (NUDIX family)